MYRMILIPTLLLAGCPMPPTRITPDNVDNECNVVKYTLHTPIPQDVCAIRCEDASGHRAWQSAVEVGCDYYGTEVTRSKP